MILEFDEFELVTRWFELVTCGFVLLTRRFVLVTHGFELVTRGFELVTHGTELVIRRFGKSLITCKSQAVTSNLFFTISLSHNMV